MAKAHKPKRIEDLPQFKIMEIKADGIDPKGFGHFTLTGVFDRLEGLSFDPWCWLLLPGNDCLCGTVQILDSHSRTCAFQTETSKMTAKIGQSLAHLSAYWQAFNVWMVLDPNWGWRRNKVAQVGVKIEIKPVTEETWVGKKRVTAWAEVNKEGGGPQTRYVPLFGKGQRPLNRKSLSKWGHETCTLCYSHIDAGKFGYVDPDARWMCLGCYRKYVVPHDLSFTD